MTIPFQASRLKIWRASHHVDSLEFEVFKFCQESPPYINIRPGPPVKDKGMVYYEIVIPKAIPITFSAIVGDILHNLRASLDLLACDLVSLNNKSTKDVHFPFAKNEKELDQMIKHKKFDRASKVIVDHYKSLKPFVGGNKILRAIHDLDIIDKHSALIPAVGNVHYPFAMDENTKSGMGFSFPQQKDSKPYLGKMLTGYIRADWRHGEKLPVSFDVVFPSDTDFVNQPLVPLCKSMVQDVSSVTDSFESLCFGTITKKLPWS